MPFGRIPIGLGRILCVIALLMGCGGMAGATPTGPGFQESGYSLVYDLSIPSSGNYATTAVPYSTNNAASIPLGSFDRIGYYVELQKSGGALQWVSISMDAFTTSAAKIGVPTASSGAVFQQAVSQMNVASNIGSMTTGSSLSGGYIQFWPSCYSSTNSKNVPNASNSTFDWGDTANPGTVANPCYYGAMQIADDVSGQALFSYNGWSGNNGIADLGLGNQGGTTSPTYTFAHNASTYVVKDMQILVHEVYVPEPASGSLLLGGLGLLAWARRSKSRGA